MIEYFNEDCMVGMARYPDKHFELAIVDLYAIKPFGIPYNVRKIPSICLKWNISRHKHTVDLRNMHIHLPSYFRLIGYCFTQLDSLFIILYALFVIVCTTKGINPKVKSFRHVTVEQVSDLACIKADKSENVNLAIVVTLRVILSVTFDIKNIRLAFLRSLRNDSRLSGGLYLNTQKALSIIHDNVIRKPLFARKCNKALHNKVCANKVLASFANLEFIAKSHNITSHTLYLTYCEMPSAKSNNAVGFELDPDYYEASKQRLERHMAQIHITDLPPVIKPEQIAFSYGVEREVD